MADIDERVLKMTFDNDGFEQGVDKTIESLSKLNSSLSNVGTDNGKNVFDSLQSSANSVNFDALNQAIETINYRFSDFGVAATRIIENLTDTVLDFSTTLAKSLTIEPVTAGWGEYNELIDISRLIKANTSATMEEINAATDQLNEYADLTKYQFINMAEGMKQMVQSAGSLEYTFSSGVTTPIVDLVEGVTNLNALTGGSNANLTNLMEVFSRGLLGSFNQQSYYRIVRNGAAGKIFEELMRQAAENVGQSGMLALAEENAGSFADSFSKQKAKGGAGWANPDVIAEAMRIISDTSTTLGRKAYQAATEATTFQELMDQSYEALQSGWTRIWRSIIGDLEEAKDVWFELNLLLNGQEGFLTRYADWFGTLAEGWRELGGRENLISGLIDALQGILNIVEAIKDTITDLFPGLDSIGLAEASESFGLGASKFKKWTEDLRKNFGSFIGGYDIWKEVIEDEPIHHTETWYDEDLDYTQAMFDKIDPYLSDIHSWMAKLVQYDEEGQFDLKATKAAISKFDFSSTDYAAGDKELKSSMKNATELLTALVAARYGGDGTLFTQWQRQYYSGGVMSDDSLDQDAIYSGYQDLYLAILREMGIDSSNWGSEILEAAKHVEEWDEPQSHEERKYSARVVKGNDWFQQYIGALWDDSIYQEGAVDGVVEIYNTSQSLVKVVYAITSGLRYIWDTVKNIYEIMVKPLVSSVLFQAVNTIIEVVGRFSERFTKFINTLRSSYFLENIAYTITNIINRSANFQTFFDKVTAVLLKINTIVWDLIENVGTVFDLIGQNQTLKTIRAYADYIWNYIIGPLISNDTKAGAAAGGIIGGLFGAIKGFFTGGPWGMIVGGIQGLINGAVKGGALGKITGVLDYLLNHTNEFLNVLKRFKERISELWESFTKGFKSATIGENNPLRKFFEWVITALENLKKAITSADPLGAINNFLNSKTMDNIIETLKKPFETAGEFIGNTIEFISTNVGSFFNSIGTKWDAYMKKFDNNPLEAFFNLVKDSALVSALSFLGATVVDFFTSFKEGLFGIKEDNSDKVIEDKLSLYTRITNFFRNIAENADLKAGIPTVNNGLKLLGSTIRELWKVVKSGDLFGIIADGFSAIVQLGGSLLNGIRGVPDKLSDLFSVGDKDSKSFSERVHEIRESLDKFLSSDAITELRERFHSFGEMVSGFFSNAMDLGKNALGGFFSFITNNKVIDFLKEVKDTIGDFASALIEGFTGTDFKDNIVGFLELLTQKLQEFKESDVFESILDKIKTVGQKLDDLFEWLTGLLSNNKEENSEVGIFASLTGWLSNFSLPKIDTKKAEKDIEEAVNNITTAADNAIQNNEEEHKTKSGIGYVFESILGGLFGVNVYASEMWDDNVEDAQGAGEAIGEVGKVINEINKDAPKPKESEEASDNIGSFVSAISVVGKVVAGAGGAVILGAIALFFTTAFGALKSVFNVMGIVNSGIGYVRAKTIIKYIEAVGIIVAAIGGLAIVLKMIGPDYSRYLTSAVSIVAGAVIAIFSIMAYFSKLGDGLEKTATEKPFLLLSEIISSIADGIKDIMKGIAFVAPIIAIVAAVGVIAHAIQKLAEIDPEPFNRAAITVVAIAGALILFMIAVNKLSKELGVKEITSVGALSASIVALGGGIFLVTQSIIQLVDVFKNYEGTNNTLNVIGAVIGSLVAALVILVGGLVAINAVVGENPLEIASVIAAAIGIIAVGAAMWLMVDSLDGLIAAVSDAKLDYAQLTIVFAAIATIVLAMGGFVRLAAGEAVKFRSMAALFVLVAGIKLIMGSIVELLSIFETHFSNMTGKSDQLTGAETFMNVIGSMVMLIVALGGAIKLMQGSAVKIRTTGALFGLIAGVALVLVEIKEIFNILSEIPVKDDGPGATEQFIAALGGIVAIIAALVGAVKILQQKEIKNKEKTSTGFLAAISAIVLMGAVYMALGALKDFKGEDLKQYENAIKIVGGVFAALTGAIALLQFTSKNADGLATAITAISLIGSVFIAIAMLDYAIKDTKRISAIADALKEVIEVIAIFAGAMAVIDLVSKGLKLDSSGDEVKQWSDIGQMLTEVAGIVAVAAIALTLVSENIEDSEKLLDVANAMSEFIAVLAGVIESIALVANFTAGVDAGLATLGKITGVISLVGGIIAGIYSMFTSMAQSDNGIVKTIGEGALSGISGIGSAITTFAGFLGEIVKAFKEGSFIEDSEVLAESTDAIGTAMTDLTSKVDSVDLEKIQAISDIVDAFGTLKTSLNAVYGDMANGEMNQFTRFGEDIEGFGPHLASFLSAIIGIQGKTIDTEFLRTTLTDINDLAGIKFEVKDGFFGLLSKEVGVGEIGATLGDLGAGLYAFYSYATLMSDQDAITSAVTMANDISTAFGTDAGAKFSNLTDAKKLIEGIGTGIYNATNKLAGADTSRLGVLALVFKSLADIASAAYVFDGDQLGIFDFLSNLDLAKFTEGLEKSIEDTDALQTTIDQFSSKLRNLTSEKQDEFREVGKSIGLIVAGGLTKYFESDSFSISVGWVVIGLKNGIENNNENILEAGKLLAQKVKQGFDDELIIESPSKEFFKRGKYIVEGLINGIEDSESDALEVMRELGEELGMAFTDSVDGENLFGNIPTGKLLLAKNQRNAANHTLSADEQADSIIKKYYKYLHGSAKEDSDYNKISEFSRYRDSLVDLYNSRDEMPDTVKRVVSRLNNYIKESKDNRANRFNSNIFEDISNAVDDIKEECEETTSSLKDLVEDILYNTDLTDKDSIKNSMSALDNLREEVTDLYGGATGLLGDKEGLDFYSFFRERKDYLADQLTGLVTTGYNYVKKTGKTLFKDLLSEDKLGIISTIGDMINSGEYSGSLSDGITELFGTIATSKDIEDFITGDFLKSLLKKTGLEDFDPEIITQLLNISGDMNDVFNNFVANGYDGTMSELIDSLSYIQEAMGSLGANGSNSDLYHDLSALLGFDPFAVGEDTGTALGESIGEAATETLEEVDERITDMAMRVISGEFGNNPDRERLLEELGLSFGVIQNEVNRLLGCNYRYQTSSEDLQRTLSALGDTALDVEDVVIETTNALEDMGTGEALKQFSDEDIVRGTQSVETLREKFGDLITKYFELSKYADSNGLKRDASMTDLRHDIMNIIKLINIGIGYKLEQQYAKNEGREEDTSNLVKSLNKYLEENGEDYANVTSLIAKLVDDIENGKETNISESLNKIINALQFASDESKVTFNEIIKAAFRELANGDVDAARQDYLLAAKEYQQAMDYAGITEDDFLEQFENLVEATNVVSGAVYTLNDELGASAQDCATALDGIQQANERTVANDETIIEYYDKLSDAASTAATAMKVANDENFEDQLVVTPIMDDSKFYEIPGMLPAASAQYVPLDFTSSVGFDNVNSIASKFDKNLDDNSKVLMSMERLYDEVGLLNSSIAQMKIVLDTGTIVGEITPAINQQLQTNQSRRERGI